MLEFYHAVIKGAVAQFVIYFAVTLVAVVGASNYWMYVDSKRLLEQNMDGFAHEKLLGVANASAYYFSHFEIELIGELVKRVAAEPRVNYIRVTDASRQVNFAGGEEQLKQSRRYSTEIMDGEERLGSALLDLDVSQLQADINATLIRAIITFLFSVLLIGGLVYFYFRISVVNQIERSRQEKERLREEHDFITSVIDTSSHMMVVLDRMGNVVLGNHSLEEKASLNRAEAVGQPLWSLLDVRCNEQQLHKDDLPSEGTAVAAHLIERMLERRCLSTIFSEGDERIIEWRFKALRGSDSAVKYIIGNGVDVTRHHLEKVHLSDMAHRDNLTGLANRYLFEQRLDATIQKTQPFTLLYIDLDKFKPINDRFGHEAGDHVLVNVAKRLQRSLRDTDTVARIGGDEFSVILTDIVDAGDAAKVADKLLAALVEPFDYEQTRCQIGASIGIACFPADADEMGGLTRAADQAMYQAKEAGRNTYRHYHAVSTMNFQSIPRFQEDR
ncbi:MAG: sensor domain-containing diguanylate cyclase [Sedimenticola sp.]